MEKVAGSFSVFNIQRIEIGQALMGDCWSGGVLGLECCGFAGMMSGLTRGWSASLRLCLRASCREKGAALQRFWSPPQCSFPDRNSPFLSLSHSPSLSLCHSLTLSVGYSHGLATYNDSPFFALFLSHAAPCI